MKIKVGCCGFPGGMKKYFETLPDGRQAFKVVEVQKTFYQPPQVATAERWRSLAGSNFEFTLKAWQLITHDPKSPTYRRLSKPLPQEKHSHYGYFRPTDEVFSAWEVTEKIASALEAVVILFQCPASFRPTAENKANMRAFFGKIDRKSYLFAWEPRGKWQPLETKELCQELNLIHCVDPFKARPLYGDILYFRLHGKTGYKYRYADEELTELEDLVGSLGVHSTEAYVLFNNTNMAEDALRFEQMMGKKY